MPTYYICKYCIGKKVEGVNCVTPCVRWLDDNVEHPDPCPKMARGVVNTFKPSWEEVDKEVANDICFLNEMLNARTRIFVRE